MPERLRHGVQALWTRGMAGTSTGTHAAFEEMVLAKGLGDAVARRRGMKKAIVALARRLAVMILGQQQIDKTDPRTRCARHGADDAGGIYRPVHVKTLRGQKLRMLPAELSAINPYAVPGFNTDHP